MLNLLILFSLKRLPLLSQFHIHALLCPAISCPAFSCPVIWSVIFMSCNFMPCTLVRQFHVRHFHVQHFQRPTDDSRVTPFLPLKRVKMKKKLLWGPIGTHLRSFERYHHRPPTASPSPRLGVRIPHKTPIAIISGTGKATNFKFGHNNNRVHPTESP